MAEDDNDGNNVNANGIEASAKSTNETSVIVNGSLEDEVENFPRAKNGEDGMCIFRHCTRLKYAYFFNGEKMLMLPLFCWEINNALQMSHCLCN